MRKIHSVGNNFKFDPNSSIFTPQLLTIGDNVFIGEKAHIAAHVTIGNNVMFGPRPMIIGGNHLFGVRNKSMRSLQPKNRENVKLITIEDEVWCGAGIIILGGMTLGMGSVIGAGSVVTKSIPPFTMAVGNPCKVIKKIFSDEALLEHIQILGKSESEALEIIERRNAAISGLDLEIVDHTNTYWDK